MKKNVLLLGMVLLSLLFSRACALETYAAPDGSIRFEGSGHRVFYDPVLTLSNGKLLIAVRANENDELRTWVICIEPNGSAAWSADVTQASSSMFVSSMNEQLDGSLCITTTIDQYKYRQQTGLSMADGSILWQQEPVEIFSNAVTEDGTIGVRSIPVGEYYLSQETHDCSASCQPVYFQLETPQGDVLWRAKDAPMGMTHFGGEAVFALEKDLLLAGHDMDGVVLQRMDENGDILWRTPLPETLFPSLQVCMPNGQLVLCCISMSGGLEAANPRWDQRGFAGLSAESGQVLWEVYHPIERGEPTGMDSLLYTEQGLLLAGGGSGYEGCFYQLLDDAGNKVASWTDHSLKQRVLRVELFEWQHKPWACVSLSASVEKNEAGVALVPVRFPDMLLTQ